MISLLVFVMLCGLLWGGLRPLAWPAVPKVAALVVAGTAYEDVPVATFDHRGLV